MRRNNIKLNGKEIQDYYNKGLLPQMMEKLNLKVEDIIESLLGHIYGMEEELDLKEKEICKLEIQVEDIVQVRAFAVSGPGGELDFSGFNAGYQQFFGTDENPMKPVRSFVQIAGLVVDGWLIEIEIRAARVPD